MRLGTTVHNPLNLCIRVCIAVFIASFVGLLLTTVPTKPAAAEAAAPSSVTVPCKPKALTSSSVNGGTAVFTLAANSCVTKITFSSYSLPGGHHTTIRSANSF